jgi:hypothetical protein
MSCERGLDIDLSRGIRLSRWMGSGSLPMEWRVAELESEMRRLRSQFEALQLSVSRMEERRRNALSNALFGAALVVTAVLYVAMAIGFGWI